jgi:transcriptional regulator with GAF, ATPase, and Fis domain
MSSEYVWRAPEVALADNAVHNQVILENRLGTLREVALTLLREVESLREVQPIKQPVRLHDEVQRFEVELINSALSRSHGNQTHAARLLGVKLTTLNSKIKRYKIPIEQYEMGTGAELQDKAA